ncbi:hypothetical protein [uncultured Paludibaculum sp.]|uniref:hypothetical protein n=1 Tax=uncultured Paludibaculum sp. TaxID=1765020 RepID=UPI002AAC4A27|nr:hypothetical protein [uncultured Paludibaculum sp.]
MSAYNKGGRTWRTILIKSPISDADLVALARYLHDLLRDESIRIVDDASQIKAYEDWDQNYPDAAYPFPEQWVRRHHIATINKMLAPGGAAWQLMGGSAHPTRPESKIADLE